MCVISCCLCLHFYFLDQVPSSTMVIRNLCLETPRTIVPAKVSGFKRAARIDDFMERTLLPITEGRVSRAPALHKCLCVCALPPFQHRIVAPKSLEAAVVCFGMEAAARDAQQLRSFVFDFLPFFPKGANFFGETHTCLERTTLCKVYGTRNAGWNWDCWLTWQRICCQLRICLDNLAFNCDQHNGGKWASKPATIDSGLRSLRLTISGFCGL